MNIPSLEQIRCKKEQLLKQQGILDDLESRLEDQNDNFYVYKKQLDISFGALEVIREAAKLTQVQFLGRLSDFTTGCIQSVFGNEYRYELILKDRGKGLIPQHVLWKGDTELSDPVASVGGGMVQTIALALRVACLRLLGKTAAQVLILDEPYAHVSTDLQTKIAGMLLDMNKNLGIQVIMISHEDALVNGLSGANIIRIEK